MAFKKFFNDLFSNPSQDNNDAPEETETVDQEPEEAKEASETRTAKKTPAARPAAPAKSASAGSLELKICKPQSFSEVGAIADHLLNRCTVVLNLETASKENARRIVDFLNGVSYSIDGQIKPVANNTFVLTPHSVSVTGEENDEVEEEPEEAEDDSSFANF